MLDQITVWSPCQPGLFHDSILWWIRFCRILKRAMEVHNHLAIVRKGSSNTCSHIFSGLCAGDAFGVPRNYLCLCFWTYAFESNIAKQFLCHPESSGPALCTCRMLEMAANSSPQLLFLDSFYLKTQIWPCTWLDKPLKIPLHCNFHSSLISSKEFLVI